PAVEIGFGELDDFHPDRLFDRLEVFQALKLLRKRLHDPATFADAASQVRSWSSGEDKTAQAKAQQQQLSSAGEGESNIDALERLLGRQPVSSPTSAGAGRLGNIDAIIREAVRPYIVPSGDPQRGELLRQVDQAIAGQMRVMLHHAGFGALEAAWRALHWLVSEVETDETLRLYLIDVSKAELAADLTSAADPQSSQMYRLLVDRGVGPDSSEPWTLLLGVYTFDQEQQDLLLLRQLAKLAQAAGAPLLAAAGPRLVGCQSVSDTPDSDDWHLQGDAEAVAAWGAFRLSSEAAYIGLTFPRFLLRLPYGTGGESIDRFAFEELVPEGDHQRYLWGNGAFLCAHLFATAFRRSGWSLTGELGFDVTDLPMHTYKAGGETLITPCAEAFLSERAMQALIEKGLIPILSVKGRNAVQLPRFQSVAAAPTPLAGRWR
ncbi:MAG: type VI secretion system contractile sheath large subunit, partial [Planctomycetes bacterium]|nr:type VI secretion system contractile sheath large subunit [Planctomycetota bacterium]